MQNLLECFITKSVAWLLVTIVTVTFLESLALVGLILPGTVMMAGLGTLISKGYIKFWQACIAGIVGCILGDWVSFWIGRRFKKVIYRWSFMKSNKILLNKTGDALHQHSMLSILIGRFIGPIRPLLPMVAGMLDVPVMRFVIPSIIGCLLWPLFYFLPGLLVGAAISIPITKQSIHFKWLLLITLLLLWLVLWLYWRLWRNDKKNNKLLISYLPHGYFITWLTAITLTTIAVIAIVMIVHHPILPIYLEILLKIISN